MFVRYDIEPPSGGEFWDRANVGVVNGAMNELDKATQQNTSLVGELSRSADALRTMVVAYADVLDGELEPTGPREGFDSGDPQTSTVVFFEGHGVSVGVWECTPGGWAIVDRPTTETMLLLSGTVTITATGHFELSPTWTASGGTANRMTSPTIVPSSSR